MSSDQDLLITEQIIICSVPQELLLKTLKLTVCRFKMDICKELIGDQTGMMQEDGLV